MRIEFKDLTGKEFGYLTVIECLDDTTKGYTRLHWRCKCKCGNDNFITTTSRLTSNNTKSCGCLKKESSPNNGKKTKKYNDYEVQEDYVIMYTSKGEPFYVDLEDFWKVKDICWHKDKNGYIVDKHSTLIHRVIMDSPKGMDIDHIHGEQSRNDNRKENLRVVTHQQNMMNCKTQTNNTSGYTGVSFKKERKLWVATLCHKGKHYYLGASKNKEEAIKMRKEAENKYQGEFSYDNSQSY